MVRDVYCIRCGKKFKDVQFDENLCAEVHCSDCGLEFTLNYNINKAYEGIPVYTPEELTKVFKDSPSVVDVWKRKAN